MEFRKSIINDNGLIRRDDHLPYSVKKIKILIVKSKMAGSLKIMNFKNFSNFNSGFTALFKKTALEFRKSIINYNELTRGYVHLEYSVKKIKILIVKSKMATVLKLSNSIFTLIFVIFRLPHLIQRHACTAPIFFYPTRPS